MCTRATAAEVFGVAWMRSRRSAPQCQGDQLWPDLRHERIRPGQAASASIRKTAKAYIDVYFARYPGVRDYMERTRAQAADQGYVETLFGRRLYLPDINSNKPQERAAAERTAINAPMQGTAADIIKKAMVAGG